jgi:hypothetical protein
MMRGNNVDKTRNGGCKMKRSRFAVVAAVVTSVLMISGCGVQSGTTNTSEAETKVAAGQEASVQSVSTNDAVVLTRDSEYPDYYADEVRETIKTVRDKQSGSEVSYIFITDIHADSDDDTMEVAFRTLNALVDVANNTDIDFVCIGGDLYDGMHAEANGKENAMELIQSMSDVLKNCNKPVFILHGNHDDNSFSAQKNEDLLYSADYIINHDEWYSVTMANFSEYATDYNHGYYYYDLPNKNVRIICLNMSDVDDTVVDGKQNEMGMYFYGYKDAQIDWLLNVAMSRENCSYYIMSHDAFDYPQGYADNSNRDTLREILSSAYQKTAFSNGTFSKDFTNWSSNLVLMNCGHLHMERHIADSETGGLVILNTNMSKFMSSKGAASRWSEQGYSMQSGRERNTITESVFNVVISRQGSVDIVRFGAGDDVTFSY